MLVEINKRLVTALTEAHPEFRDVGRHRGRMTVEDVQKVSVFSPALRVGLFGKISTTRLASDETLLTVPFAAAVIVSDGDLLDSQDKAIALALDVQDTLAAFAPGMANEDRDWPALPGIGLCDDLAIDIAEGEELEKDGIALWAVLFKVTVILGVDRAREEAESPVDIEFPDDFAIEEALP